jgi:glycosyltransferase involved in cell wall biosynthesis
VSRRVPFAGSGVLTPFKYGAGVAHFIPISKAAARSLVERGVDPARMTVVPSGVDTGRFASAHRDERLRSSLGGEQGALLVGTVAAFEREKGIDIFVEAAALLHEREPTVRFVAAGEGRLERRIRAAIRRRGLDGTVRLTGPPADLAAMLAALDIFVLPSLEEGLSTALIAAAAAGLPCVASDTGGIPEVIGDGAGMLFVPGDAPALAELIAVLIKDGQLRGELGEKAARGARAFDIEKTVDLTISVYRAVAGEI